MRVTSDIDSAVVSRVANRAQKENGVPKRSRGKRIIRRRPLRHWRYTRCDIAPVRIPETQRTPACLSVRQACALFRQAAGVQISVSARITSDVRRNGVPAEAGRGRCFANADGTRGAAWRSRLAIRHPTCESLWPCTATAKLQRFHFLTLLLPRCGPSTWRGRPSSSASSPGSASRR